MSMPMYCYMSAEIPDGGVMDLHRRREGRLRPAPLEEAPYWLLQSLLQPCNGSSKDGLDGRRSLYESIILVEWHMFSSYLCSSMKPGPQPKTTHRQFCL